MKREGICLSLILIFFSICFPSIAESDLLCLHWIISSWGLFLLCRFPVEQQPLELFLPGMLPRLEMAQSKSLSWSRLLFPQCGSGWEYPWLAEELSCLFWALPGWFYSQVGEIPAASWAVWLSLWTSAEETAGKREPSPSSPTELHLHPQFFPNEGGFGPLWSGCEENCLPWAAGPSGHPSVSEKVHLI